MEAVREGDEGRVGDRAWGGRGGRDRVRRVPADELRLNTTTGGG